MKTQLIHSQRERRRVPQSMIHNQSTYSMEAGEQISVMPLEDKDRHGGFRDAVVFSCQLLIIRNQEKLTRGEHVTFCTLIRLRS
jgi:hypothetical protein